MDKVLLPERDAPPPPQAAKEKAYAAGQELGDRKAAEAAARAGEAEAQVAALSAQGSVAAAALSEQVTELRAAEASLRGDVKRLAAELAASEEGKGAAEREAERRARERERVVLPQQRLWHNGPQVADQQVPVRPPPVRVQVFAQEIVEDVAIKGLEVAQTLGTRKFGLHARGLHA